MLNDDAYANAPYIPDGDGYPDAWEAAAREWREVEASLGRARLNQPYGPGERERFDLFYPAGRPEGLVVFLHGGFWWKFGREWFSHVARGATGRGWAMAVPSYTLAPEAGIDAITRQAAAAVEAAARLVAGPVAIAGHSAGGHLTARLMCADVPLAMRDRVVRAMPVSPLSDLHPLIETTMNRTLKIDADVAARESPALLPPAGDAPVLVWVGGAERPAFLDQARWLAAAWPAAELHVEPGRHHMDVIADFEDADSALVRWLVEGRLG